jgi:hypothetical protein
MNSGELKKRKSRPLPAGKPRRRKTKLARDDNVKETEAESATK